MADADPTEALRPLSDFVTIDTAGWATFRHALVRDVAYEGLPFATRRQLHGRQLLRRGLRPTRLCVSHELSSHSMTVILTKGLVGGN